MDKTLFRSRKNITWIWFKICFRLWRTFFYSLLLLVFVWLLFVKKTIFFLSETEFMSLLIYILNKLNRRRVRYFTNEITWYLNQIESCPTNLTYEKSVELGFNWSFCTIIVHSIILFIFIYWTDRVKTQNKVHNYWKCISYYNKSNSC